jgi:hypothetical protein
MVACQRPDARNCLRGSDEATAACDMTAPVADGISAGLVLAVRGHVVDVRFAPPAPRRDQAPRTGADASIVLEVASHLACAASCDKL